MDQPQPCTKCKKLPEDILMLACSHDLCLDCASDRLAFEMKKKKPANVLLPLSRVLFVKFAMNAQLLIKKALENSKNLSLPRRLALSKITQNRGNPMIESKEWIDLDVLKSIKSLMKDNLCEIIAILLLQLQIIKVQSF